MKVEAWLKGARTQIDRLDAELIAVANFGPPGADRSWLVANNVVKITTDVQKRADEMVKRRQMGEPLAYILGKKEFYGREFMVNPAVLIPRPETENLVDLALGLFRGAQTGERGKARSEEGLNENASAGLQGAQGAKKVEVRPENEGFQELRNWRILEVGTGSGCLAVTLALELPEAEVEAVELSEEALAVAEQNARNWGARVRFWQSDLLSSVPKGEKYDLVVANLPYVDRSWEWIDQEQLGFEPELALYAEEAGLGLYRRLLEQLGERKMAKSLILEADPCQHQELVALVAKNGFGLVKIDGYGLLVSGC